MDFFSSLSIIADHPLVLVAYLGVLLGTVIIASRSRTANKLFKIIKELPEKQRLEAIQLEYKTVPKAGLSAEQWLQNRKTIYQYTFILCVLVIILGFSSYTIKLFVPFQKQNNPEQLNEKIDKSNHKVETILKENLRAENQVNKDDKEKNKTNTSLTNRQKLTVIKNISQKEILPFESDTSVSKEQDVSKEIQLTNYMENYIEKYGDIDLNLQIRCDKQYMERYRKAKAFIELINVLAKELNRKDIEKDFITKRYSGVPVIVFNCELSQYSLNNSK